jgi:hypothetical protein
MVLTEDIDKPCGSVIHSKKLSFMVEFKILEGFYPNG